jgi:hypothetical protein
MNVNLLTNINDKLKVFFRKKYLERYYIYECLQDSNRFDFIQKGRGY